MNLPTVPVQIEVPISLMDQVQKLIDAGQFCSMDEMLPDALQHFLEADQEKLMQNALRQDLE